MKIHNGLNTRQLFRMMAIALSKEKALWTSQSYSITEDQKTQIGPEVRDEMVRWLVHVSKKLKFHPETVVLAVSVMDRFLILVKAHSKYVRIIGVASLYLSAKILEEDVMLPGALEMVHESECGCSVAELLRMERVILDKLNWDVRATTILDFIHLFHALLMSNYPQLLVNCVQMTPSRQMTILTRKVQHCLAYHDLLTFKPSVVALSLLSLELELFSTDWFTITTSFQNMMQIDGDSLMLCREKLTVFLCSIATPQMIYLQSTTKHTHPHMYSMKAAKRKVKDMENEDDVYDAIKRLYNEEENVLSSTKCSIELLQDSTVKVMSVQTLVK